MCKTFSNVHVDRFLAYTWPVLSLFKPQGIVIIHKVQQVANGENQFINNGVLHIHKHNKNYVHNYSRVATVVVTYFYEDRGCHKSYDRGLMSDM